MRRIASDIFYRDMHDRMASGIFNSVFWHGDGTPAERVRVCCDADYRLLLAVAKAADRYFNTDWTSRDGAEAAEDAVRKALDALNKEKKP